MNIEEEKASTVAAPPAEATDKSTPKSEAPAATTDKTTAIINESAVKEKKQGLNAEESTTNLYSDWSKDRLMGIAGEGGSTTSLGATSTTSGTESAYGGTPVKTGGRLSLTKRLSSKINGDEAAASVATALWGRPGHLTEKEADVYLRFKEMIDLRGGDFKDTVYCFGLEEGEVYALCRWCRARKYNFEDIMMMVEEATKCRAEGKTANFYPNPKSALGCDTAVYAAQYPQVYSGVAKNGSPLYFSKIGNLNVEGIECITTVSSIVKYHWYVMIHDFANRLRSHKKDDPTFTNFECVCVMDLGNLTMGQIGSKCMTIVKEQSAIDSLCFPETLNKMYIINSPRFFSATWGIIKGWLDPRTANKIEVISNRKTWETALLDYVDPDQLPSDYGGIGPNTKDTMEKETFTGKLKRLHSEVMYVRGSGSITYDIISGEELEVSIYTRSVAGAKWAVSDAKNKHGTTYVGDVLTKHTSGDEAMSLPPLHVQLTKANIKGPASIKLKAESLGSRWSSERFLVVFSVFNP